MFANWRAGAALLLISLGWLTPAQAVDIQRWQTAHGAKVLFVPATTIPCWMSGWTLTPATVATAPTSRVSLT